MSSKYSTIQQHEPLRVPAGWGAQEKKFVAQLEEILDDLYRRFGRLKKSDLGDALRESLSDTEGNVSELTQTSEAFQAAFESIGTLGAQTGITKVTQEGVEVNHSAISTTTRMNAEGFKIVDAGGKVIGGLVVIDGKVYLASQAIMRPDSPGFRIGVADRTYEGEQMGLHWVFDNAEKGAISAHAGGMRQDVNGAFFLRASGAITISGANGAGITIEDDGYMTLRFTWSDSTGAPTQRSLSMQFLCDMLDRLAGPD